MFTKYTGVEIPKNYSGNRFKQSSIEDTKMKTHRGEISGVGVKTAVSPSFQSIIDKTVENSYMESNVRTNSTDYGNDTIYEQETQNNDIVDNASSKQNNESKEASSLSDFFKSTNLTKLLELIEKDDLLLIALLVILASEGATDVIPVLALLLLFR